MHEDSAGLDLSPRAAERVDRDPWLSIELRHLAALATVARESSFTRAADKLGYAQSAVSQQIRSLERIVGHRLVHRAARPRSITPTDAGTRLLDHIEEILEQMALAKADVDAVHGDTGRTVSFGVDARFGDWLPTALLGALRPDAGGDAWAHAERAAAPELLRRIAEGKLDAAFVPLPVSSGRFSALELRREPYRLVFPADPGAAPADVEATLESWPLVRIDGCSATRELLRRYRSGRIGRDDTPASTGVSSALVLVRSGCAAAVVTGAEVANDDPRIATLALPGLSDCVIGMAWRCDRDRSLAVTALKNASRRAFA